MPKTNSTNDFDPRTSDYLMRVPRNGNLPNGAGWGQNGWIYYGS